MNFTWFASAYDTDDVAVPARRRSCRSTGVLILAAGVPRALRPTTSAWSSSATSMMRVALVAQWLRAALARSRSGATAPALRRRHHRRARSLWVALAAPARRRRRWSSFLVLVVAELPCRCGPSGRAATPWHPGHIAERYGLFTIIVLGESVLAATVGGAGRASTPTTRIAELVAGRHRRPADRVLACGGSTSTCPSRRSIAPGASFARRPDAGLPLGLRPLLRLRRRRGGRRRHRRPVDHATGHTELSGVPRVWPSPCRWRSTSAPSG